eukprot:TRINITY_DN1082_c1_g1_i1.p1 TRINITY_DN1082_c1_g1~~TRINITY_DN1082_c1_g1_i1.p1  ORF type:complete len:662 (-),score=109.53 TRINITY_DN1082_c1_g1_i1:28-2013(-)
MPRPLLYLVFLCVAAYAVNLEAAGASIFAPALNQWTTSFDIVTENHIKYTYTSLGKDIMKESNSSLDFIASLVPYTQEEIDEAPELGLKSFPFVAAPVVFIYNLPGSPSPDSTDIEPLVISRAAALGIFNGTITRWNDPLLVEAQDHPAWRDYLSNCDQPIGVYTRAYAGTDMITAALSHMSPEWKEAYGSVPVLPEEFYNGTRASFNLAPDATGMLGRISMFPYSLGYIGLGITISNAWNYVARLENHAGNIISPTRNANLQSALEGVELNELLVADITEPKSENAYPLIGFSYILVQTTQQISHICERRREVWKFFLYILTKQNEIFSSQGFVPLIPEVSDQVLQVLGNATCDGISLLAVDAAERHDLSFIIPVAACIGAIIILSIGVVIFLLVLVLNPKDKRLPVPMSAFGITLFLASIIGYVSVAMWLIVPTSDHICMARVWLGTIAVSIMLGASISRASQIKRLNAALHSISKMEDVMKQKLWYTFIDLFVIFCVQLVILIIWQSVDPYRSVLVIYDVDNNRGAYECASDSLGLWGAEVGVLAIIVIYGMIEIYQAWNLPSQTNQSKWLLFSLYNTILTAAVCLPIISLVDGEEEVAMVAVVGLIFLIFQMQVSFMVPSFYSGIYRSTRSSQGSHEVTSTSASATVRRSQKSAEAN